MQILIKNGQLYDGYGSQLQLKDILIEDEIIKDIANTIDSKNAYVIDAKGLVVTPGFIDMHRHADYQPFVNERFGELELLQGITTCISGNCGLASVPYSKAFKKDVIDLISPCLGDVEDNCLFKSYDEYVSSISTVDMPLNFGFLAGTGAIKSAVKGFLNKPYSEEEMRISQNYIESAMQNGAFGASVGIMYQPECFSTESEFKELLKPISKYDGIVCCHIRGEGDSLVSSVEEIIRICEKAEVRLNISHLKATGKRNWNSLIYQAVEVIEKARNRGLDVSCDFYPYDRGSTTLQSLIPPNCLRNGTKETMEFLGSKEGCEFIHSAISQRFSDWDNMVESIGWDRIVLGSVPSCKEIEGKSFYEASQLLSLDEASLLCRLFCENEGKVGISVMSMSNDDIDYIASLPYSSVISDALYGSGSFHHPRLYGAFPRFINRFVKEKKTLSLEEAIYKMTVLPAKKLHLQNRGSIAVGNVADINIFDINEFTDNATYENPKSVASGLRYSFINGTLGVHDGIWLGKTNIGGVVKGGLYE